MTTWTTTWSTWVVGTLLFMAAGGLFLMHGLGVHGTPVAATMPAYIVDQPGLVAHTGATGDAPVHTSRSDDAGERTDQVPRAAHSHTGAMLAFGACVAVVATAVARLLRRAAFGMARATDWLRAGFIETRAAVAHRALPRAPGLAGLCRWIC